MWTFPTIVSVVFNYTLAIIYVFLRPLYISSKPGPNKFDVTQSKIIFRKTEILQYIYFFPALAIMEENRKLILLSLFVYFTMTNGFLWMTFRVPHKICARCKMLAILVQKEYLTPYKGSSFFWNEALAGSCNIWQGANTYVIHVLSNSCTKVVLKR